MIKLVRSWFGDTELSISDSILDQLSFSRLS